MEGIAGRRDGHDLYEIESTLLSAKQSSLVPDWLVLVPYP